MTSRILGVLAVVVALAAAPGAEAAPPLTAAALSRHDVAQSQRWKSYVLDRSDGLIYPKHVYVVAGSPSQVENPTGLMAPGGGTTTIHSSGKGTPRLVLDLGIDAGGYVEVGVTKTDGSDIHLGYAEARRFLTADGDQPDFNGKATDDAGYRVDDITTAGDWRSPGNRGGERWISIQLQSSGTVSIDYVRIREEHLHPALSDYVGHFLSSDDLLNRIWYAAEYTFSLDSVDNLHSGQPEPKMVGGRWRQARPRGVAWGPRDREPDGQLRAAPGATADPRLAADFLVPSGHGRQHRGQRERPSLAVSR